MMLDLYSEAKAKRREIWMMDEEQIKHYWPGIIDVLADVPQFLEYYDEKWVEERAKMGLLQIWALADDAIRAIVVTQVLVFPKQRVFEILAANGIGLLEYFDEMDAAFEHCARKSGCQTIAVRLRPGLERLIKKRKLAETKAVILSRPVGASREH